MGTKKQAENLQKAQLMALFGETPESTEDAVSKTKKTTSLKEEAVLTKDEFFRVLNLVTRPGPFKGEAAKERKERNIGVVSFR